METIIKDLENRVARARREYARNRAEQQELVRTQRVIFLNAPTRAVERYDYLWRRNDELQRYVNQLTNAIAGLKHIDDITLED
ncbi:MAG: hypothetical protein II986_09515 [Alistipes sp.]|nr:hypothetical protein [Alistipes sp.]